MSPALGGERGVDLRMGQTGHGALPS
jgi:hypothetical protein